MDITDQQYQRDVILKYKKPHHKLFVETGTALGETSAWASLYFEKVITVEFADDLYRAALERFFHVPNVTVMHGDSADLIKLITYNIHEPTVFWLDAHYDGGDVPLAPSGESPVTFELTSIFHHSGDNVILVDDARLFGNGKYPNLGWVERHALGALPSGYNFLVENDVIQMTRTSSYAYRSA